MSAPAKLTPRMNNNCEANKSSAQIALVNTRGLVVSIEMVFVHIRMLEL